MDPECPAQNFIQCKANDTTFGRWPSKLSVGDTPDTLVVETEGERFPIQLFAKRDPGDIPWGEAGVTGVAECTGVFRSRAGSQSPGYDSHLNGGAQRVALSAPAKDAVLTVVYGVHKRELKSEPLLSAASQLPSPHMTAPVVRVTPPPLHLRRPPR